MRTESSLATKRQHLTDCFGERLGRATNPDFFLLPMNVLAHLFGFFFCVLGFVSEAALAGGLILFANAYLFALLTWQGDKYGIWSDPQEATTE